MMTLCPLLTDKKLACQTVKKPISIFTFAFLLWTVYRFHSFQGTEISANEICGRYWLAYVNGYAVKKQQIKN